MATKTLTQNIPEEHSLLKLTGILSHEDAEKIREYIKENRKYSRSRMHHSTKKLS